MGAGGAGADRAPRCLWGRQRGDGGLVWEGKGEGEAIQCIVPRRKVEECKYQGCFASHR